jgi:hypothetical protein
LELAGVNSKPKRVPEDDFSEGSADHVAHHSSSEGEVTRLDLGRQLSVSPVAQTELDNRIARLTGELTLRNTLLEQDSCGYHW